MRTLVLIAICSVVACREAPTTQATSSSSAPSASASVAPASTWKPHKLSKVDAEMFCAELVEGGIASKCAGHIAGDKTAKSDVDVFGIPGRQRTEASGTIVFFPPGEGSFPVWIAESLAADAGVDPVYHYNANVKMLVTFNGDVPEETKLRVVEALDAL